MNDGTLNSFFFYFFLLHHYSLFSLSSRRLSQIYWLSHIWRDTQMILNDEKNPMWIILQLQLFFRYLNKRRDNTFAINRYFWCGSFVNDSVFDRTFEGSKTMQNNWMGFTITLCFRSNDHSNPKFKRIEKFRSHF